MPDLEELSRIFKVLSVNTRLRIVNLLKGRPLCVNALARALGITSAAVSQHLRILRDAGIVIPIRRGYFIHYRLNTERLAQLAQASNELLSQKEKA